MFLWYREVLTREVKLTMGEPEANGRGSHLPAVTSLHALRAGCCPLSFVNQEPTISLHGSWPWHGGKKGAPPQLLTWLWAWHCILLAPESLLTRPGVPMAAMALLVKVDSVVTQGSFQSHTRPCSHLGSSLDLCLQE